MVRDMLGDEGNRWNPVSTIEDLTRNLCKHSWRWRNTSQGIVDLTCLAATIHAWNRLAIALRALPGHYRATKTTA